MGQLQTESGKGKWSFKQIWHGTQTYEENSSRSRDKPEKTLNKTKTRMTPGSVPDLTVLPIPVQEELE